MRYLFAGLIDEEIRRDEAYRNHLKANAPPITRAAGLHLGRLPPRNIEIWTNRNKEKENTEDTESITTPRANGLPATTPGLTIGVASPGLTQVTSNTTTMNGNKTPSGAASEEKRASGDYFSNKSPPVPETPAAEKAAEKSTDSSSEGKPETAQSPTGDADKESKSSSLFSKKLRLNFPKKLTGRSSVEVAKPAAPVEDKSDQSSDKSSEKEEKPIDDNFHGLVQKMRIEYDSNMTHYPEDILITCISTSMPNETPVLKPPPLTSIIIQEDSPDSGGLADLYRGTVGSVGQDADLIEGIAPTWLGELLLHVSLVLCRRSLWHTLTPHRIEYQRKTSSKYPSCCYPTKIFSPASQVPTGETYIANPISLHILTTPQQRPLKCQPHAPRQEDNSLHNRSHRPRRARRRRAPQTRRIH